MNVTKGELRMWVKEAVREVLEDWLEDEAKLSGAFKERLRRSLQRTSEEMIPADEVFARE